MRIISFLILSIAWLFFVSCDSSIEGVKSFPSPDQRYFMVIVTELQAANDPTPFWTHISIRKAGEDFRKIPGNIGKFVGKGRVEVEWQTATTVNVNLPYEIVTSKFNKIPEKKEIYGISIMFVMEKPQ